MQKNLLFILFIFLTNFAFAQNNLIEFATNEVKFTNVVTEDNGNDPFEFIAKGKITNVSDQTLSVRWQRVFVEGPAEWEAQTCDFNQCWSPIVESNIQESLDLNEPLILMPGDTSNMDVYLNPNFTTGTGQFTIEISLSDTPDEIITSATYNFDIQSDVNPVAEVEVTAIKVFPNPTADYIRLENSDVVDELVIYNMIGRKVRNFEVRTGARYNVADLPTGLYLVSMVNEEDGILKTVRLSKHSLMP